MRSRAIFAAALLTCTLVTGGWLMERGTAKADRELASGTRLFDEVLQHVRNDYVDTLTDSVLYRHAIDGALAELHDPHTVFLDPKRKAQFDESTSGHYAGVGIQMDVRDSGITVIGTLPGTPAEIAGIITGDLIVSIDGKTTHGLTSDEALKTLRGAPETQVRVVIDRPGVADKMPFTLVRKVIEVNPVQHAIVLPGGIGYVGLTIFSADAATDLAHAIDSLRAAGATSLIFDLRGDPGGLLDQGVGVADLFLDAGQDIVSTRGRGPDENHSFSDHAPQRWPDMPMIVLADSQSASASEIVAGALQDHDRALVVGTATYGKGSAQRLFPVGDGAVKVTTALWYTPSGRSINRPHAAPSDGSGGSTKPDSTELQKKFKTDAGRTVSGGGGIVPDVIVPTRASTPAETALQAALGKQVPRFRETLLEYALSLKGAHTLGNPEFRVTAAMRTDLYRRLETRDVKLSRAVYDSASPLIDRLIGVQATRYVFGREAEFLRQLRDDPMATRATQLLTGMHTQKELLARAATQQAK